MSALTRSRVSTEQLDALLSFMEEHPDFAAGKQSVYSRFSSSKLWRLLAERLNAVAADSGGARKSPDKWCRYWADIKYKARKKNAALGTLGELSHHEERLCSLQRAGLDFVGGGVTGGLGGGRISASDEDRKHSLLDDDMCSEVSGAGGAGAGAGVGAGGAGGAGEGARVGTEELLAEAAMRSALAAEKQAEAVTQAVELLRELVDILRPRAAPPPPPPGAAPPPPAPAPAPLPPPPAPHVAMTHHHRM